MQTSSIETARDSPEYWAMNIDDEPTPETLAARFLRLRKNSNLTQEELAQKAGVSKAAVQLIEAGTTGRPQKKTLTAYAQIFGVSADYLLWGTELAPLLMEDRMSKVLQVLTALPEPELEVVEKMSASLLAMHREYEERGVDFQAAHVPIEQREAPPGFRVEDDEMPNS